MRLSRLLVSTSACALALAPTTALAQAAPVPAPAAEQAPPQPTGGDIIVTARKRQESILNVPVIETAIPKSQIEHLQTQDLKDIATLVPGLVLGDAVLSIGAQVSIWGIGTSTLDAGVDQSVSLNLDGLQLSQGLAYSSGMFDLQQIEVLKGPQNLFYGKNSPGGVISLRTADPTDKFEVIGRYGHEFGADENREELIVSGPVTDTLGLRLAALNDSSDGFFKNAAIPLTATGAEAPTSRSNPPTESYTIRGTAVWKPDSRFSARLKLNLVRDDVTEPAEQMVSCPAGVIAPDGIPFLGGGEDCKKDQTLRVVDLNPAAFPGIPHNGVPYTDTKQQFGTLELNYKLRPDLTLTSTTGYYNLASSSMINAIMTTYAAPPLDAENNFHRHDFTEELRANSDFAGPFNFTAGAFHQDAELHNLITLRGNADLGLPALLTEGSHNLDITSESIFGQVRYKVTSKLEAAFGARWQHEDRSDTPYNLITGTAVPVTLAEPKIHSDHVAPEVTLSYKPTSDMTLFGSLKQGYKSGSFTVTTPVNNGDNNAFGDERIEGGELGLKSRWFDRQLVVDLTGYDYRYRGLQVGANSPAADGLPVVRTVNAGSALIYGVDFDAAYHPRQIEGLSVQGSVAWNHARFKVLNNVPCWGGQTAAEGCQNYVPGLGLSQNLAGQPLVRAPDWQVNFGVNYEMPLRNGMKVIFSNSNQFSTRYLDNLGLRSDFYQKSFYKTDLSVTVQGPRDQWEIALIGKNLNNALTTGNCTNANVQNGQILGGQINGGTTSGPAGPDTLLCFIDRGREVWLRLTLKPFS